MENNIYYVYAWLRKDGTPYYIGKGKNNRAYANYRCFSPKDKSRIVMLTENVSEKVAFHYERVLISHYGRKDLGTGILYNRTAGGEGTSGQIVSEEVSKKISIANKGRKQTAEHIEKRIAPRRGIAISAERKAKQSATMTGKPSKKKGKAFPQTTCVHCNKTGDVANLARWHFNNCKMKANHGA